jgi:fused signal recognition particle receptor
MSFLAKLKDRLTKTRERFGDSIRRVLALHPKVDDSLFDELEEALIDADVGVATAGALKTALREKVKQAAPENSEALRGILAQVIQRMMAPAQASAPLALDGNPAVLLIVGVNGSGKTTTIAKLANRLQKDGKKVLLAAGDTFRAAATEQLMAWGERLGLQVIHQKPGADPAAVAFDAFQAARARGFDVLIIDTAGRLHNKANLMQELEKIGRVLKKTDPSAPHEVLLVLDANTGQNMIQQARVFQEISGVTGLILAKLDGTAKGGAVISICHELRLPVRFVGLGERLDDLDEFNPEEFAQALLSINEMTA